MEKVLNKQSTTIGFIGLGKMGAPICENILNSGFDVIVFNRTHSKTKYYLDKGAKVAQSIRDLVMVSDVIISCVCDEDCLISICDGDDGFLDCSIRDKIHISLTSIKPSTAEILQHEHNKCGAYYISAPIIGVPALAKVGKLKTFISGESSKVGFIIPLVQSYTSEIIIFNDDAKIASSIYFCANYLITNQITLMGEIFTYAEKSNLSRDQALTMIEGFFGGSDVLMSYAHKIYERDIETIEVDLIAGLKDVLMLENDFESKRVRSGSIQTAKENLCIAASLVDGEGEQDWIVATEISRRHAGL
jgi:3-hydroxyisobutyrate dehydrogenase-like beta-hydroxyacid dehydrogenase